MVRRRATFAVLSILLVVSVGCNEDPQRTPFNLDTGNPDAGQSDIEVSDTGSQDAGDVSDAREWFETACETTSPRDVTIEENEQGNWAFAVPEGISNYRNLDIDGFDAPHAAAVMSRTSTTTGAPPDVAGAIFSEPGDIGQTDNAISELRNALLASLPEGVTAAEDSSRYGDGQTPNGGQTVWTFEVIESDEPMRVTHLRNEILLGLAPFSGSDTTTPDPTNAYRHGRFRLRVAIQEIPSADGGPSHRVASIALWEAGDPDVDTSDVAIDISKPASLAPLGTSFSAQCAKDQVDLPTPWYFYFVIDVDGPEAYEAWVESYVAALAERVSKDSGNFIAPRFGFTNDIAANEGELVGAGDWLRLGDGLQRAVREAATDCRSFGGWRCEGERDALSVTEQGLSSVKMKPKSERELSIVLITDEQPASIQSGRQTADSYKDQLAEFEPTFLHVLRPSGDCVPNSAIPEAYGNIGADFVDDLCELQNGDRLDQILYHSFSIFGTGNPSNPDEIDLRQRPIPSTIQVFQNDLRVPRSRTAGFSDRHTSPQSITLHGPFSAQALDLWRGPYFNVARYYSWDYGSED